MRPWLAGVILVVAYPVIASSADSWQMPVGLAWSGPDRIGVVSRDGQSFFLVQPSTKAVIRRTGLPVPAHSIVWEGKTGLWLVGTWTGQVLELDAEGQVMRRIEAGRGPTQVLAWSGDRLIAAPRWDRRVVVLDRKSGRVVRNIDLPFPPGSLLDRTDGKIIVADAFGGGLATLDPEREGSVRAGTLDGVRLQGLALSPFGPEVLIGHMDQYNTVPVTATNLDWGLVFTSRLSSVSLKDLDGSAGLFQKLPRRRLILDGSGNGAADPSAIAQIKGGTVVLIATSGAGTVLFDERNPRIKDDAGRVGLGESQTVEAVDVGRRPLALAVDPSETVAAIANASDGTISLLDLASRKATATIPLSPGARPNVHQRGEAAFHDARLALDRWISCASCHIDGHTNGLSFDTLGDGDYGAAKNTPSLLGSADTAPYAWTGRFASLEHQVSQSFDTSLRGPAVLDDVRADVTAYIRSLAAPPPRMNKSDPLVVQGESLFQKQGCMECHAPPRFTTSGRRDGGIGDGGRPGSLYNPPSLRGIGWSAPYFHDGRAASLDEVIRIHPPNRNDSLSAPQRRALATYLESL